MDQCVCISVSLAKLLQNFSYKQKGYLTTTKAYFCECDSSINA